MRTEIKVTRCGPDQDYFYVIDGAGLVADGTMLPVAALMDSIGMFQYRIREVTRLEVCFDANVVVNVEVEGDEETALDRAAEIAAAFEKECENIVVLGDDAVGLGVMGPICWRNEDSEEETYK